MKTRNLVAIALAVASLGMTSASFAEGPMQRVIRAEADAEAARIYAQSYGKDPGFYDFYRAMQSYDATFGPGKDKGESSIILSPDNEYLRQFRGRR